MVTNITNLSRSGLYDWMLQRLTAIVLGAYSVFLLGYLIMNPGLQFSQWAELFDKPGRGFLLCWHCSLFWVTLG